MMIFALMTSSCQYENIKNQMNQKEGADFCFDKETYEEEHKDTTIGQGSNPVVKDEDSVIFIKGFKKEFTDEYERSTSKEFNKIKEDDDKAKLGFIQEKLNKLKVLIDTELNKSLLDYNKDHYVLLSPEEERSTITELYEGNCRYLNKIGVISKPQPIIEELLIARKHEKIDFDKNIKVCHFLEIMNNTRVSPAEAFTDKLQFLINTFGKSNVEELILKDLNSLEIWHGQYDVEKHPLIEQIIGSILLNEMTFLREINARNGYFEYNKDCSVAFSDMYTLLGMIGGLAQEEILVLEHLLLALNYCTTDSESATMYKNIIKDEIFKKIKCCSTFNAILIKNARRYLVVNSKECFNKQPKILNGNCKILEEPLLSNILFMVAPKRGNRNSPYSKKDFEKLFFTIFTGYNLELIALSDKNKVTIENGNFGCGIYHNIPEVVLTVSELAIRTLEQLYGREIVPYYAYPGPDGLNHIDAAKEILKGIDEDKRVKGEKITIGKLLEIALEKCNESVMTKNLAEQALKVEKPAIEKKLLFKKK